jgi:muconate cycloisomerase
LDAYGKKEGRYLTGYFSGAFATETVYYGTTIPLLDAKSIERLCRQIKDYKIKKVRLKVGNNFFQNQANFESIKHIFFDGYDLKIDANGSWSKSDAFDHIPLIEKYQVKVVEQPMSPKDPALIDFASQMNRSKILVMADESVCSLEDIQTCIDQGFTMVNIRLSKCGGFRRSFEMIDFVRDKNLRFQIGCHLGESGILSAAGRVMALLCKDAIYYDGSYDAYLLKQNTTTYPVSFGLGGKAEALQGSGLGVEVDLQSLRSLCDTFIIVNAL